MITRILPIEYIDFTVINPVVNTIIQQINKVLIQDPDAYLNLTKPYEEEGVEYSDYTRDNSIGGSNIDYTYEIEETEELNSALSVMKPVNKIIMYDEDINFLIRLMHLDIDINLEIRYRSTSKTTVNRLINKIKAMYYYSSYVMSHTFNIGVLLNPYMSTLLKTIKDLKDPDLDLETYANEIALYKLDKAIKPNDKFSSLAFRFIMPNVYGYIRSEPQELKSEKQDIPEYGVSFKYQVSIRCPYWFSATYPIIINNKRIPNEWLPMNRVAKPTEEFSTTPDIHAILKSNYPEYLQNKGLILANIPTYDEWSPYNYNTDLPYVKVLSILIQVEDEDPYRVASFDELIYCGIPKYMLEYMKSRKNDIVKLLESLVYLEIYEGVDVKDLGLYVDDDYVIRTSKPMDKTKIYHLVVNVLFNKGYLPYKDDDPRYSIDDEFINYSGLKIENKRPNEIMMRTSWGS